MLYDKRNREAVMYLDPVAAKRVAFLFERLEFIGEEVLIYSGKRSPEEQDALFRQGGVTHLKDSNSYHVWGMAIDVVPIGMFGRACWNATKRYETIAREAKVLGFEWGYQMWAFDMPHLQYTRGLTIKRLKKGAQLQYEKFIEIDRAKVVEGRIRRIYRKIRRLTGQGRIMAENELRRLLRRKAK